MAGSDVNAPLPAVPSAGRRFQRVDGVRLHVVTAGAESDPLVVLLHGFPEFWYGWRAYVPRFVDAGYLVLVPTVDARREDGHAGHPRFSLDSDVDGVGVDTAAP